MQSLSKRIVRDSPYVRCNRRALAVAMVMISCKIHGKIINLGDIIEDASRKRIRRLYRNRIFDMKINLNTSAYIMSIITKACSTLRLERCLKGVLLHTDATMVNSDTTGINLKCIAGYCVYRATKIHMTLKAISRVLSVSISCISRAKRVYR